MGSWYITQRAQPNALWQHRGVGWWWVGGRLQREFHFSSVTQLCPTLCNPMHCSMPGFPVYHQLPELAQAHVHWVGDAIQPSHPLSSPSPPAFNLSQDQGLFKWVSSFHQVAKVLPMNIQDWFPLGWTGWISLQSKGLSAAEILRKPPSDLVLYFHGHWLGTTT